MTHHTSRRKAWAVTALGVAAALSLTACAGSASAGLDSAAPARTQATHTDRASASSSRGSALPAKLVSAATAAAKKAAAGKKLGGTLSVLGINTGAEENELLAAMKPFEQATGVTIKYTGTEDQAKVLAAGVESNNPPDIVDGQGLGLMVQYAEAGKAVPLTGIVSAASLKKDFSAGLIDSATIKGKVYGIWGESDTFQVWYNTKTYTGPTSGTWAQLMSWATKAAGKDPGDPPFCMGMNAGAGSGFPGESWIESVFVGKYGPAELKKWADGQLAWTSPQVKWAWEQLGRVAASKTLVQGGPQSVVSTSIVDYSKGMFSTPQGCQLSLWGNYAAGLAQGIYPSVKVPQNLNFFTIPASTPAYAKDLDTDGHVTFLMKSTPASRAFMKYWETPAAQSLIAAGGSWTVGNRNVPLSAYPNAAMKRSAQMLQASTNVVPGPAAVDSSAVDDAYASGIISYIQDPSSLDSVLATIQAAEK